MTEENKLQNKTEQLPIELPLKTASDLSGVEIAEKRMLQATTAEEALVWTSIRAEIRRQDRRHEENTREAGQSFRRDYMDFFRQMIFLGSGIGLIIYGYSWIGGFLAAAAAYPMAKDFVMEKFPKLSFSKTEKQND